MRGSQQLRALPPAALPPSRGRHLSRQLFCTAGVSEARSSASLDTAVTSSELLALLTSTAELALASRPDAPELLADLRLRLAGWPKLSRAPRSSAPLLHAPHPEGPAVTGSFAVEGGLVVVRARTVARARGSGGGSRVEVSVAAELPGVHTVPPALHWGAGGGLTEVHGVWTLTDDGDGAWRTSQRLPGSAPLTSLALALGASREFRLPLPAGILASIAATAASAGDCVARISLSLGRDDAGAGSVLAIVRSAELDGSLVVELFSDVPHALRLEWGLLDASGAWHPPPPALRPQGTTHVASGALITPFSLFTAALGDGLTATLLRACLAFAPDAASDWAGVGFVLRSADGSLAWRHNWSHYRVPWTASECAVAWVQPEAPEAL